MTPTPQTLATAILLVHLGIVAFNIFGQQYLPGSQVAYVAHLAGLVAGLLFSLLLLPPGRRR